MITDAEIEEILSNASDETVNEEVISAVAGLVAFVYRVVINQTKEQQAVEVLHLETTRELISFLNAAHALDDLARIIRAYLFGFRTKEEIKEATDELENEARKRFEAAS